MSTTKFTIDIDKQLKEDAFTIIKSHGVTPEQAIQLFFQQIVETKVIPLKGVKIPNDRTKRAMLEFECGEFKSFDSVEELMAELNKE